MNAERRKKLERAIGLISEAQSIVNDIQADEQSVRDNLPEEGERAERQDEILGSLEDADDSLTNAAAQIEEAMA